MSSYTLKKAMDLYLHVKAGEWMEPTLKQAENALYHLSRHFGDDRDIASIKFLDIELFKAELTEHLRFTKQSKYNPGRMDGKSLSTNTVRQILVRAKALFAWCVRAEIVSESPFIGVKLPTIPDKRIELISDDDLETLITAAGESKKNRFQDHRLVKRDPAMILFFASTGCRRGGIVSAQIGTLERLPTGAKIEVLEKGGKTRLVPISPRALAAVDDWLTVRPDVDHDYLFTSLTNNRVGAPLTPNAINSMMKRLKKAAGLEYMPNAHRFRHTASIRWQQAGLGPNEVSQMLGNSETVVTKYYSHFKQSEVIEKALASSWVG